MPKFENVDIFDCLKTIMRLNTGGSYRDSFASHDKRKILGGMVGGNKDVLYWISAPDGTFCETEHDIFIADSQPNKAFLEYVDSQSTILLYAVEPKTHSQPFTSNLKIYGDIYPMVYVEVTEAVIKGAAPLHQLEYTFKDNSKEVVFFNGDYPQKEGVKSIHYMTDDEKYLEQVLDIRGEVRDFWGEPTDLNDHFGMLYRNFIDGETDRIAAILENVFANESMDLSGYPPKVSEHFRSVAKPEDYDTLIDMLESHNIFGRAIYDRNNPKTPRVYDVYIHDLAVDEILERKSHQPQAPARTTDDRENR